jgi:beta-alanine degradation protein BauB
MYRLWPCMALLVLISMPALGQDPAKVDPKHVKVEFENEFVRVLRVRVGSHENVPMHEHPARVVVSLTDTDLRSTAENVKTAPIRMRAGETHWVPPLRHAAENLRGTPVELIEIELKGSKRTEPSKNRR